MPTGAGKSICYQLPALLLPGITVVISPLISLMKDQVRALNEAGVHAAYINSSLSENQIRRAMEYACAGRYKIIYVAPERLLTPLFLDFAHRASISMVTVDEAHCISQWGQDFRPSYLNIVDFVEQLPVRPVVGAFTATATTQVRDDILCVLNLQDPKVMVTGFDRENLYFEVRTGNKDQNLRDCLREHEGESGIIYCATRKNVETVYDAVSVEGLLHRTRKLVETNCPKNVELKEENELSGECVLGNATQLQQVMLNISINAIHAIGTEGGKLTIRGSVVPRSELAALFPEEKISEEWSSYVCLSVTDTGCGMDKETLQHIFEPFFTTKKTGEGTGLGLALADQIIRTHRGRIRAESTIGRGTTFYVYLPVLEQQQEREQLQWGVDSKLRILAADDNNKVLDLLDKDLSALGLSVSTCSRRGELRQLLEQQPFDVLAIDESLMSSSGVDFCMAIRGRYPGMTRIVMTNAPTREIVDARSHGVIDGYVVKPVSASTLLAQIRNSRKE